MWSYRDSHGSQPSQAGTESALPQTSQSRASSQNNRLWAIQIRQSALRFQVIPVIPARGLHFQTLWPPLVTDARPMPMQGHRWRSPNHWSLSIQSSII